MNPTEQFQTTIINAVNTAAQSGEVHPALVYTILAGTAADVLTAIKQSNRAARQSPPGSAGVPPASPASPPTPPNNVVPLS